MRRKPALLLTSFILAAATVLSAQTTMITAGTTVGGTGAHVGAGTIAFKPTNLAGNPLPVNFGSFGGPVAPKPIACGIPSGAVRTAQGGGPCQVVDTSLTYSTPFCYATAIYDSIFKQTASGGGCVQPTGSTWSLDTYKPVAAPTAEVVAGLTSPAGPAGTGYISGLSSGGASGTQVADKVAAAAKTSDTIRSGQHWFDVRSKGAFCDGHPTSNGWSGTDDTSAFQAIAANANGAGIEIPPSPGNMCSILPGPSTASQAALTFNTNKFILRGQTLNMSIIQDATNAAIAQSNAPLLQIGTGESLLNGTNLNSLTLRGAYNVSYPKGMLRMYQNNLTTIEDLGIQFGVNAANSYGLYVPGTATTVFGEMRFNRISIYGGAVSNGTVNPNNTGIFIQTSEANTDFTESNIEKVAIGVDFSSTNGTPILNWAGGHFERIPPDPTGRDAGLAFRIRQAQLHLTGANIMSGMIYLDPSTVNSNVDISMAGGGWGAAIVDNGVGNQIHLAAASYSGQQALNLDGSEQYKTPTLTSDPLFLVSGASGWTKLGTTAHVTLSNLSLTSPGAKAGQAVLISSTDATSGAYITTQTLTPGTEYELVVVLQWIGRQSANVVNVIDNQSGATIYTASVQPTMAIPTAGGYSAYRVLRAWIPASSSATTWQIQVVPSAANNFAIVTYVGVNPSSTTMASGVPFASGGGLATCTSASHYSPYLSANCAISGRVGGANASQTWTPRKFAYATGAYVRMHIETDASAVAPMCKIGTLQIYFLPNTSWEYNVPVGFWPASIVCQDAYGPKSDPKDMVVSQLSVVPIYQNLVVPITTPNDGEFVTGITPDGVQQRTAINLAGSAIASPVGVSAAGSTEKGNSGDQPLNTWTGITLAAGKCMRFTGAAARMAGSATNTFKIMLGGTVSNGAVKGGTTVASWTYTSTDTSTSAVFHALVCNNAGTTTSQFSLMDAVFNNTSSAAGAASLTSSASTSTANSVYFTFNGASTEEFTPKGAVLELLP